MLNIIKDNFQIIYYDLNNTIETSLNLMSFGYKQFKESFIYQNREKYTQLCNDFNSASHSDLKLLSEFAFNKLIDCIRISICFENYFKSKLLTESFIIHKLDNNIFPVLSKEQKDRPIHISEIPPNWYKNEKIKGLNPDFTYQIKGINNNTIGMSVLTKMNYLNIIQFDEKLISICQPFFEYRNKLHLYLYESGKLNQQYSEEFNEIINFINDRIVNEYNELSKKMTIQIE